MNSIKRRCLVREELITSERLMLMGFELTCNLLRNCEAIMQIRFQEGMVEFIGMLKVKVLKGTNLAVRDVLSSDPYIVLKLGKQVSSHL